MENTDWYGKVVRWAHQQGGTANAMEALGWDVARFDEGFAIANELQNRDWVKLLYSNYNKNLVVVELTLLGQQQAERA